MSDSILPSQRQRRGFGSWARRLLTVFLALTVLAGSTAAAAVTVDRSDRHHLLPGISIMGIDMSGLTRAQAEAVVSTRLATVAEQEVAVSIGGEVERIALADLGVSGVAAEAVDRAFDYGRRAGLVRRLWRRQRNLPSNFDVAVALAPDPAAVAVVAERLASEHERDPVNARLRVVSGRLALDPARPGQEVDPEQAAPLIEAAARDVLAGLVSVDTPVAVPVSERPPAVTDFDFPLAILVRIDEQKLYLYQRGELTSEFEVASGLFGYDTPLGDYQVTEKILYPTWYNPAPTTWGRGLPLVIGPGPGNPLGTRAIGIDSEAIFLHETLGGVGYRASHGCVRMQPDDLQSFYERVPVGAPVFIMEEALSYVPTRQSIYRDEAPMERSGVGAAV